MCYMCENELHKLVNCTYSTAIEKRVKAEEAEKAGNEFEYLERNEFTSEIFKIEVKNLGYFGIGVSC